MRVARLAALLICLALPHGGQGQSLPAPVPQGATQAPTPPRPATPPAAPARPPVVSPPRNQASPTRTAPATQANRPRATPARPPAAAQTPPQTAAQARRARAAAAAAAAAATAAAAAPPPAPAPPPEPTPPQIGTVTGLQLPRFAALRSDEVNMRAGPGTRFPIEWTYQRRDMPVEIVREFDLWRRIRDQEGVEGWVHSSTLAGRRSFLIRGHDRELKRRADDNAPVVARLRPGVIGRLLACPAGAWCEVRVGEYRGFLKREDIWGVGPEEIVQ